MGLVGYRALLCGSLLPVFSRRTTERLSAAGLGRPRRPSSVSAAGLDGMEMAPTVELSGVPRVSAAASGAGLWLNSRAGVLTSWGPVLPPAEADGEMLPLTRSACGLWQASTGRSRRLWTRDGGGLPWPAASPTLPRVQLYPLRSSLDHGSVAHGDMLCTAADGE